MQFSEEKKAPLDRVGRKVKKKIFFLFLGSGPKIGSVGTWETDNQLDVPLYTTRSSSRWTSHVTSTVTLRRELGCHCDYLSMSL